jgi:hypothetical protein
VNRRRRRKQADANIHYSVRIQPIAQNLDANRRAEGVAYEYETWIRYTGAEKVAVRLSFNTSAQATLRLPQTPESVPYVLGMKCHSSVRKGNMIQVSGCGA